MPATKTWSASCGSTQTRPNHHAKPPLICCSDAARGGADRGPVPAVVRRGEEAVEVADRGARDQVRATGLGRRERDAHAADVGVAGRQVLVVIADRQAAPAARRSRCARRRSIGRRLEPLPKIGPSCARILSQVSRQHRRPGSLGLIATSIAPIESLPSSSGGRSTALPVVAAVLGQIEAALAVGVARPPLHRGENAVGVGRVDRDRAERCRCWRRPMVRPRGAAVGRSR